MRAKAGRGYVDDPEAGRPLMGSLIIVNNLQVAFVAFALGITGIGTVMTLVFNGVLFGGVLGVYSVKGIAQLILAFVAPHGVLELSAIAIAGGAGLLLTTALLLPGKQTRRDALVTNAKRALKLIVCAILFMSIAGMLEGFVSPIPWWPIEWKAMVALATLVVMILYLTLGRTRPSTVLPAT